MLILFPYLTHMRALHMEDMAWWEMSTNNNPIQKEELHSGTYCHKHYQMVNFKNAYNMDVEWQTNYRSCKNMDILEFLVHLTSLLLKCMDPKLIKWRGIVKYTRVRLYQNPRNFFNLIRCRKCSL